MTIIKLSAVICRSVPVSFFVSIYIQQVLQVLFQFDTYKANFQCTLIQLWMMIIKRYVQSFECPFNPITSLWGGRLNISWSTVWGLRQAVSKNECNAYPLSPRVAPRSNQLLSPSSSVLVWKKEMLFGRKHVARIRIPRKQRG